MDLYISDLDGTLLTPDATITEYSRQVINRLIDAGINFSVATARSPSTVQHLLQGVNLSVPVVLMNGACLFDVKNNRIIKAEGMAPAVRRTLFQILQRHQAEGFIYTIDQNKVSIWYETLETPEARQFVAEREQRFGSNFTRVHDFAEALTGRTIVNFSITDTPERLNPLYRELSHSDMFRIEYYQDVYRPQQNFLEACAVTASKYHAVRYLRKHFGFDKVTCFGDNLNDLPLFLASDRRLAVGNAQPEVKEQADSIIGSNKEDGVAFWLHQHLLTKSAGLFRLMPQQQPEQ
jgi:hypothetical protein